MKTKFHQVLLPSGTNFHLTEDRQKDKKFPCSKCTSVFSYKGGLKYHEKFECSQPPRFYCAYCSYRARHVSNTRKHIRRTHPGEEIRVIDICHL